MGVCPGRDEKVGMGGGKKRGLERSQTTGPTLASGHPSRGAVVWKGWAWKDLEDTRCFLELLWCFLLLDHI